MIEFNWISVKEKLPEFHKPVFVTDGQIPDVGRYVLVDFCIECWEWNVLKSEPTHWMPIPPLPLK